MNCEKHEAYDPPGTPCQLCWADLLWYLGYRGMLNPDGSYSDEPVPSNVNIKREPVD